MSATPTIHLSADATQDDLLVLTQSADTPGQTPRIYGRYEVLGLLGAGAMGHVYKVRDVALDEVVALKALNEERVGVPGLMARFRAEVKLARRVLHPNVVRTYDLGEHEGETFLTMEYVPGRSLRRMLAVEGPPSPARALHLLRQAAEGVAAAHRAGVLHCDLKPDNLLLTQEDRLVIADFGVARALGGSTGLPLGTPAYAAPEQLLGAPLDPRADLYGLGAVFYELLSGRRLRPGEPDLRRLASVLHTPPDPGPLTSVPDALASAVLRCLAPSPEDRFADAEALLAALGRVDPGESGAGPSRSAPTVPMSGATTVAVLPLRAEGLAGESAEALTEELIDALTATCALKVRPLRSVLAARAGDPQEIGRALGVGVVVSGSVRQEGESLRLRVRAITVSDGFQVWATRVTCGLGASLAAMDGIARGLAEALAASLPARAGGALPLAALDLYLRGRTAMRTGWDRGTQRAAALFEEALTLAPDDARLLSALAMAVARDTFYDAGGDAARSASLGRARAAAERAISLEPEAGEGWVAMAHVRLYGGDHPAAAAALQRAVRLSPGLARAQQMLGNQLLEADRIVEALPHLRAAAGLDPAHHLSRMDLARGLALMGTLDEIPALLSAGPADSDEARLLIGALSERLAVWWSGSLPGSAELPEPQNPQGRAIYEVILAWRAVRRGEALPPELRASNGGQNLRLHPLVRAVRSQYTAEVLSALGEPEAALDAIEWAVASNLHDLAWMDRCPVLAPLREHPRWAPLRRVVLSRAEAVRRALGQN